MPKSPLLFLAMQYAVDVKSDVQTPPAEAYAQTMPHPLSLLRPQSPARDTAP